MEHGLAQDILARVEQQFAPEQRAEAQALLAPYGQEPYEQEPGRVQHAVLKLSGGDLELLRHNVDVARQDYRDVLYWAYGYDNDLMWLLDELLRTMIRDGALMLAEQGEVWRATRGTYYSAGVEQLYEIVQRQGGRISAAHYDQVRQISKALGLPIRRWQKLRAGKDNAQR